MSDATRAIEAVWRIESPRLIAGLVRMVRDVQYVGPVTRYHVTLDRGGELQVLTQNLEEGSSEVLASKGRRLRLQWRPEHESVIVETEEGNA